MDFSPEYTEDNSIETDASADSLQAPSDLNNHHRTGNTFLRRPISRGEIHKRLEFFDAVLYYNEKDYEVAENFKEEVVEILKHRGLNGVRIKHFTDIEFPPSKVSTQGVDYRVSLFLFIFTNDHPLGKSTVHILEELLAGTKLGDDSNKTYAVRPIHTTHKKFREYPYHGLRSVWGIDWYEKGSERTKNVILSLFKEAVRVRKTNEESYELSVIKQDIERNTYRPLPQVLDGTEFEISGPPSLLYSHGRNKSERLGRGVSSSQHFQLKNDMARPTNESHRFISSENNSAERYDSGFSNDTDPPTKKNIHRCEHNTNIQESKITLDGETKAIYSDIETFNPIKKQSNMPNTVLEVDAFASVATPIEPRDETSLKKTRMPERLRKPRCCFADEENTLSAFPPSGDYDDYAETVIVEHQYHTDDGAAPRYCQVITNNCEVVQLGSENNIVIDRKRSKKNSTVEKPTSSNELDAASKREKEGMNLPTILESGETTQRMHFPGISRTRTTSIVTAMNLGLMNINK
ncbi:hypothetical protein ScPMuIL_009243 [Solemya velum]